VKDVAFAFQGQFRTAWCVRAATGHFKTLGSFEEIGPIPKTRAMGKRDRGEINVRRAGRKPGSGRIIVGANN
jgi:hypothetical protein